MITHFAFIFTVSFKKKDCYFKYCEIKFVVSKEDQPAKWLHKGKTLPKDNRITTSVDKNTHRLVLQSVTIDDEMEYSVKIGDKVSKATIFVEGMNFFTFYLFQF
jgi:hypothetical protein